MDGPEPTDSPSHTQEGTCSREGGPRGWQPGPAPPLAFPGWATLVKYLGPLHLSLCVEEEFRVCELKATHRKQSARLVRVQKIWCFLPPPFFTPTMLLGKTVFG